MFPSHVPLVPKRTKQTKQSFVLTFQWRYELYCMNCMNFSLKRRPLTWAILIIGSMIILFFPPSWLYLNSSWQSLIQHECVMDGSHIYNTFLTQKSMSECTYLKGSEKENTTYSRRVYWMLLTLRINKIILQTLVLISKNLLWNLSWKTIL